MSTAIRVFARVQYACTYIIGSCVSSLQGGRILQKYMHGLSHRVFSTAVCTKLRVDPSRLSFHPCKYLVSKVGVLSFGVYLGEIEGEIKKGSKFHSYTFLLAPKTVDVPGVNASVIFSLPKSAVVLELRSFEASLVFVTVRRGSCNII